jgi:hypothetical protein
MSGIDERSEKGANELEQEAWEMARNGGIPKVEGPDFDAIKPKPFNLGKRQMGVIDETMEENEE